MHTHICDRIENISRTSLHILLRKPTNCSFHTDTKGVVGFSAWSNGEVPIQITKTREGEENIK
jgi:hypothetical protein